MEKKIKERAMSIYYNMLYCDRGNGQINEKTAKQCAMVAVNELIVSIPWGGEVKGEVVENSKEYWNLVKLEIQKIKNLNNV